ncbi:MAG: hypothetical protein TECD_00582 [Hyphomicrobiaceae bacterium hypho_1]
MCVGIPMQLINVDGHNSYATDGSKEHFIDLSLVGTQPNGTWVLTFLGSAREILTEADALKIKDAIFALNNMLSGHTEAHDAFSDLETGDSRLPPHLQSAFDSGKIIA